MIQIKKIKPRSAEFKTSSRTSFIRLFSHLANMVEPSLLHDTSNIPQINIVGAFKSGKSLAAEAMMRTWSDNDQLDELEQEKGFMFLETHPCQSSRHDVSGIFNVAGKKTKMIYSSSDGLRSRFTKAAIKSIKGDETLFGGAIFGSNTDLDWKNRGWITTEIELAEGQKADESWERTVKVSFLKKKIWASERFQQNWQKTPHLLAS